MRYKGLGSIGNNWGGGWQGGKRGQKADLSALAFDPSQHREAETGWLLRDRDLQCQPGASLSYNVRPRQKKKKKVRSIRSIVFVTFFLPEKATQREDLLVLPETSSFQMFWFMVTRFHCLWVSGWNLCTGAVIYQKKHTGCKESQRKGQVKTHPQRPTSSKQACATIYTISQ